MYTLNRFSPEIFFLTNKQTNKFETRKKKKRNDDNEEKQFDENLGEIN